METPEDAKDFFRDATLRICSSLDIEKGMAACLRAIQEIMPGDELMLHFYDPVRDCIRLIARARKEGAVMENRVLSLPGEINLVREIKALPRAGMANVPGAGRLNDAVMAAYRMHDVSLLQMFLETREQKYGLGHLTLCAHGNGRYKKADLARFTGIREPFTIATVNAFHHLKILEARNDLKAENHSLRQELGRAPQTGLVGEEVGLRHVMEQVRRVAATSSIVLFTGETGVGKEMVANRLHALSGRSNRPLVKFNCGAVPDTLVDSELFGHERGAFTGAVSTRPGKFEQAHNGTLFLDEVGELSPTAQVRLLRVLQNGIVERVGGTTAIRTNARIIAATNRDLSAMVGSGGFRQDLWFRLNVFPIHIPPLRERPGDIPLLAHHLIREKSLEMNLSPVPWPGPGTMERLLAYGWPGNVRELKNAVERALILNRGEPLEILPGENPTLRCTCNSQARPDANSTREAPLELDRAMKAHIEKVLDMARGKIHGPGGAAELLSINAGTLRHRMDRLGIVYGRRRAR